MGAVYRARDVFLDEIIALKVLDVGVAPTPTAVLRFREEVRLARRVTHPKVARVFDIGEHEGVLFLTMELIEGSTLRDLLKAEHRLDRARAAGIAQAIVEGLSAVHAAGIIHRDLKPENILIDRSGRVALSDFGIARNLTGDLDITSGVLGTPNYMAPEQASARNVDARADIYALGLVLFELFTGVRPLGATEGFPDELARAGMTPAFGALVLRCIELDPAARPRSVDEVRRLLHDQPCPPLHADVRRDDRRRPDGRGG
jgi:serine/threonine-protein kinase